MKLFFISVALAYGCLPVAAQSVRDYDGALNNLTHPEWGQAGGPLLRVTANGYGDLMAAMGGEARPNPRLISNEVFDQTQSLPNALGISDYGWAFGQFIDHDLSFVGDHPTERADISVPAYDAYFDPTGTGSQVIPMFRSKYNPATGHAPDAPRMQINEITAWMDGSNIYGSTEARAHWLRTGSQGELKVSAGGLLPYNTFSGELNDSVDPEAPFMLIEGPPPLRHFVAGDIRANEQPVLTALHTLFVREHNRLCNELAVTNPTWTDEQLYQHARRMVVGFIQVIAFEEWLPALGIHLDPYTGYDDSLSPNIMNVFSAAAFRLGHSLINGEILRLGPNGEAFQLGNIQLRDAFFNARVLQDEGGIEPLLRGLAAQRQQTLDAKVIHDLRNFLFGPPGAGGLDLVAININRGRERGLADYNSIRSGFGLSEVTAFSEITLDPFLQQKLAALYENVRDIDPWVGMLAEDHLPGAAVGETIAAILQRQFTALRNGDRFYFEHDPALSTEEVAAIKQTRLSAIIERNADIVGLQENVFFSREPVQTAIAPEIPAPGVIGEIGVYPNPVGSFYTLRIDAAQRETLALRVFDMLGRIVERRTLSADPGFNEFRIIIDRTLVPGMYVLALTSSTGMRTKKLLKQ